MAFGFFDRIKDGLEKTRKSFVKNVESIVIGYAQIDDDFLDDLEAVMLTSDLGPKTTEYLMKEIRRGVTEGIINHTGDVMPFMEDRITEMLIDQEDEITLHHPEVILVVGVNGVGKTTTIGKLAARYKNEGKKVLLAAADTFRAGAIDQLVEWGNRSGVEVVTKPAGSDPAAVVFDALAKAKAENYDILLVDTAGRLQNKDNLMKELEKIGKVIKREIPDAPHETILALDATTGQNAIQQAKEFSAVTPITGIALTKLDGSAKGGIVLSIVQSLKIPVKLIGLGEKLNDLQDFDEEFFVRGLFKELL